MRRSLLLLMTALLLGAAAQAQEPADEAGVEPETPEQADSNGAPANEPPAEEGAQTPREPAPGRATMERFTPSEEISDDRSVSFPNDI